MTAQKNMDLRPYLQWDSNLGLSIPAVTDVAVTPIRSANTVLTVWILCGWQPREVL